MPTLPGQASNRTNGIGMIGKHPGTPTFRLRANGRALGRHGVTVRMGKSGAQGQVPRGGSRGY